MSNARELAELGGAYSTGGYPHFKNRIINGAMMIDQRNAGASVTVSTGNEKYPVDRMLCYIETGSSGTFTAQQSTTAPAGFKNSLVLTTATADSSIGASEGYTFQHRIEGLNVADLGWGTSNAQSVTLSFWVRSSLTGTFAGSITNGSFNRAYVFNYVINAANTWEQKTVTIAGDTGGTWLTTNGTGLIIYLSIGAGSNFNQTANSWGSFGYSTSGAVNVIATAGATFYITGVQLEKGSTATSFDYRPYGTELALCQRYYYRVSTYTLGYTWINSISYSPVIKLPVTMRSTPTLDASGNSFSVQSGSAGTVALGAGGGYFQSTAEQVTLRNSDANWSTSVGVAVTAGFGAEL